MKAHFPNFPFFAIFQSQFDNVSQFDKSITICHTSQMHIFTFSATDFLMSDDKIKYGATYGRE